MFLGARKIRNDPAGAGHFGAARGSRLHYGLDLTAIIGFPFRCPVEGLLTRIVYPYADNSQYKGAEIKNRYIICQIYYIDVKVGLIGQHVYKGQDLGKVQDITKKYPDSGMKPHVHIVVYLDPEILTLC